MFLIYQDLILTSNSLLKRIYYLFFSIQINQWYFLWSNFLKVNEYLKEIIIQEQSRREAQKAEPLEIPKVSLPAFCSFWMSNYDIICGGISV